MRRATTAQRMQFAAAAFVVAFATAAARPAAAPASTLTVTVGGFTPATPTGAEFAAGQITATVSWVIACGRPPCHASIASTASLTKPGGAVTSFDYSLDGGTTWTAVPSTIQTAIFADVAGASGSGSFLVRFPLGWASSGSPYTPPGLYSIPARFDLVQDP
jgi:hypothetical protein